MIQPVLEHASLQPHPAPFGAAVARQVSVWPFAARTARLFMLVDPSLPDEPLRQGLLRAMQQGYFGSDGYSQTRAVREAAHAAHYVLQHHNRDVLPLDQVKAASAVAAVRGAVAFVALAGNAAAFAWRDGELTSQHGVLRMARPLGLEQDPTITLWRTPLQLGDRLVLVCGASCRPDTAATVRAILSSTSSPAVAQRELGEALSAAGPAGVVVVAANAPRTRVPHLRLVTTAEPAEPAATPAHEPARERWSPKRWLFGALGLLLGVLALACLLVVSQPSSVAAHIGGVAPRMAVRLGASAANVVDMAVGDAALYTLDVSEGAVRAFSLDAVDQVPGPETILARGGSSNDVTGHPLAQPVAIEYLPGAPNEPGSLAIVDQSRTLFQVGQDGALTPRALPTSQSWQELGALGQGPGGELLFLDSGARQLLAYPTIDTAVVDEPRTRLDGASAPRVPFERVAQVLDTRGPLLLRLDDGTVHRLDASGADQPLLVRWPDPDPPSISAIASDRSGGLYLADPLNARIVESGLDGNILRELRASELAGVRAIDASLDGRRLFALVDSGILVVDISGV